MRNFPSTRPGDHPDEQGALREAANPTRMLGIGAAGVCVSSVLGANAHAAAAADADNLDQVTVTGVRSLLNDKLAQDPQDVPQSVTVVTEQLMSSQGATRLEEALKNVPGITLNAGEGAARGDTVNLRGFSAFNDFFLDGIRDAAVYTRDSFNLESVEVVKGPSAVLFGRGSTGGAINQVSKAPQLTPLVSFTGVLGTNDLFRATSDVNEPLGGTSALRVNAMGEYSHVAERDLVQNRRWGIAPSLAFGIGEADSLIVEFLHQEEHNRPDVGIPLVNGAPPPIDRENYYGVASDHVDTRDNIATARYRHDFSSDVSIADTARYARYFFSYIDNLPNFGDSPPTPATPFADILVGRDAAASSGLQTNLTNQTDLTIHFRTGALEHHFLAGVEVSRQTFALKRYVNPFNANDSWIPKTPLLDPDPYEFAPPQPVNQTQDTVAHALGTYVTDTIGVGSHFDVILGGRYDRFEADYRQVALLTGAKLNLSHTDNLGSPRAAVLYKPTALQTYYVSYGTSFDPSAEALSLTARTANLGPVKAHSYEAGAKAGVLDGSLSLTGAVFRTVVDNAQTNDPENPSVLVLNGNQRVQGLELGINGYVTQQWEVFGGYAFLDTRTLESGTQVFVGKELPNAARNSLNLWTEYEFTPALEVGVGGNWLGPRFADQGNTARVPGYVVWTAMASYQVSQNISLQLNVLNLFNRFFYEAPYYTSVSENHTVPGPGRNAMLTARVKL